MIHAIAVVAILQIFNVAHAPAGVVSRAQCETARVFRDIGVDVTWLPSSHGALSRHAISIVLVPDGMRSAHEPGRQVMGAAVRLSDRTRAAYVFYRPVEDAAARYAVPITLILACAIAHEIGHVLMPDGTHSATGLMRACWDREDFARANQGQLRFLPPQAASIRAAISAGP